MLQRIYGTAWDTQEELDQHLWRVEEAKKRDHRKLGRELDLFTFHPESPAAPFLHPRGMALWRSLEDWSRQVRREAGFHEVRTPSLVRKELWETSRPLGQLPGQHVRPGRLRPCLRAEADELPGGDPHLQAPGRTRTASCRCASPTTRSSSGKERTGVLAGMFRVRQLTQDDSHVFCRDDQVDDEIRLALVARPQAVRAVRLRAARQARDPSGEAPRLRRVLGARREPAARSGSRRTAWPTSSIPAAARSTRRRSTSSSRTPSAASGRWRRSRPTTSCRSASTSSTAPPMAASSAPSSSTTRSTARFERFIGIITEHYSRRLPVLAGAGAGRWSCRSPTATSNTPSRSAQALADAGLRAEVDDRSERMQAEAARRTGAEDPGDGRGGGP